MRFFNIDLHTSVITDLAQIFSSFGHTVVSHNLSGHASLIGLQRSNIPELLGDSWCTLINNSKEIKKFWDKYGATIEQNTDAFIVTFPPVFAELYKYSSKPIIIHIPIRYEYGVDGAPEKWEELNEYLRQGVDDKRIYLVADNLYDQAYTNLILRRSVQYIPSMCEYTGMFYNPIRNKILYYANRTLIQEHESLSYKYDALPAGHSWQYPGQYRMIAHIPYQISTMSIFEQYAAGIPLAFPTKKFIMELYKTEECTVLDQISHSRQSKRCGTPIIHNFGEYDPNNWRDIQSVAHWVNYADYYSQELMHLFYYDSWDALKCFYKFQQKDLNEVHHKMMLHNDKRRAHIYSSWESVLKSL